MFGASFEERFLVVACRLVVLVAGVLVLVSIKRGDSV
jgi:hypothetical protein